MKDKFNNRLIIPICNPKGAVVGFTGRVLPHDTHPNRPKYLNSAESDIFKKSDILFGYDLAIQSMRKKKWVIIVEGNMDVIAAHKYGITNIVASQGTSVTSQHITLLKRSGCHHVVIAFDNDNAGKISGRKLCILLVNQGFEVSKLRIPSQYKDIDEYLPHFASERQHTTSYELHDFDLVDYLQYELDELSQELISSNPQTVRASVSQFLNTLAQCPQIYTDQYIPLLSHRAQISMPTLFTMLATLRKETHATMTLEKADIVDTPVVEHNPLAPPLQLAIALSYKKRLKPELSEKVRHMYILAHHIFPQVFHEQDIDSYMQTHTDILDVIHEEKTRTMGTLSIMQLFNTITILIEKHMSLILLNDTLKTSYQVIKQRVTDHS